MVTRDYTRRRERGNLNMAETTVRSDLHAVVWKIEATPGQAVTAGDKLMILETMKMEIPVAAPRAGTVTALLVKEGDEVAEGQPLAVLQF
jgi:acetyl-CoA carboxylase biotin carboxyl carrier protein